MTTKVDFSDTVSGWNVRRRTGARGTSQEATALVQEGVNEGLN